MSDIEVALKITHIFSYQTFHAAISVPTNSKAVPTVHKFKAVYFVINVNQVMCSLPTMAIATVSKP
jgi:hypothetical protein